MSALKWLGEILRRIFGRPHVERGHHLTGIEVQRVRDLLEIEARNRRRDPLRVPGSRHFAAMFAYGDFMVAGGETIRCEGIPGISGVQTLREVRTTSNGRSEVPLRRLLTHFHFDAPSVVIEQNPKRESTGLLTGDGTAQNALLPGRATFSQYLILTLNGRPLANRQPLVMTAERVREWPPIGSTFVSEAPVDFYDLDEFESPDAKVVATLAKCATPVETEIEFPEPLIPGRPSTDRPA